MSEEPTEKLSDRNSFESRVLTELSGLSERMSALEDKVDAPLHDTRPIWEAVLSRLELIDSKLGILGLDMLEMRGEVDLLKKRQPPAA
jgi:hypothetical protein